MVNNVLDIKNRNSDVVFICESPHVDEMHHGYPLAGKSGREMSKYLLGRYDIPLGYVAKTLELHKKLSLKTFSVINISELPMQESAYNQTDCVVPNNILLLSRLRRVTTLDTKHKDLNLIKLRHKLYSEFKIKYESFNSSALFVPCGNSAQAFCLKLQEEVGDNFNWIHGIPHPAFGLWSKLSKETLDSISIKKHRLVKDGE